ncbi:hypothetical protein CHLNCDRAFT_26801 [Chlorella variabilis]|uniref:Uncharacterized protein n=1 Tax=Chlorella variabilis TaxID=554065 RepID=E1ZP60_CHLVA|nr:hypothetical protein CHLNCDRAFT_26801 [Chlorella variabilis]EFN52483.1 hypothetical protein CHLNCDRAFT_26801 [Chlorella variabilis]|eukprot:XP_005844585.1 hypothetical protein CHLNCDRAFT_26801 [Chlorella variabilis]
MPSPAVTLSAAQAADLVNGVATASSKAAALHAVAAAGIGIDSADGSCFTALHHAASRGDVACINALVAAGAAVNAANSLGQTPLLLAAGQGHGECMATLVAAGANIAATAQDGSTALHAAASYGHAGCVAALLAGGVPSVLPRGSRASGAHPVWAPSRLHRVHGPAVGSAALSKVSHMPSAGEQQAAPRYSTQNQGPVSGAFTTV